MWFWSFMTAMSLLVPVTMIGFGKHFTKNAPKEINAFFGYRTNMSMLNQDTWRFAHQYCGRVWYQIGMVLLPVSVIVMLFAAGKDGNMVSVLGMAVCFIQVIFLAGSIFPVERALKKNFDKNGNRR